MKIYTLLSTISWDFCECFKMMPVLNFEACFPFVKLNLIPDCLIDSG